MPTSTRTTAAFASHCAHVVVGFGDEAKGTMVRGSVKVLFRQDSGGVASVSERNCWVSLRSFMNSLATWVSGGR